MKCYDMCKNGQNLVGKREFWGFSLADDNIRIRNAPYDAFLFWAPAGLLTALCLIVNCP